MKNELYQEIIKLWVYCHKNDVYAELTSLMDGYKISFPCGGDFVQHCGSHGGSQGYVEPAIGCRADYTAVSLKNAKALVKRHKDKLMARMDGE